MSARAADERFMRRALRLARRGAGRAHPNPIVGAVLAAGGRVIAEGFHGRYGGPHAEANCLSRVRRIPDRATLYVTLEPCRYHPGKKTAPCADLLIQKKVRRVVIGCADPNPRVAGRGIRALRRAGIRVVTGVLAEACRALNRDYAHWIRGGRPYVVLKIAQSLDGKIATAEGRSRWITGSAARREGRRFRALSDAVLVGVETVLKDNPRLRAPRAGRFLKVILDTRLRTPPDARLFDEALRGSVVLFCAKGAPAARVRRLSRIARIIAVPSDGGRLKISRVLSELGKLGVVGVLVEGGAEVLWSFLKGRHAQEIYFFVAPKILGGRDAISSVGGAGFGRVDSAIRVKRWETRRVGVDLLIHGFV